MGILDDAIREHLELKRQHGAADSDIDRLEKEAFGPAARPGDPGYETGESPLPSIEGESPEEAPTTVAPAAGFPAADEPEASAPSVPSAVPESAESPEPEEPSASDPEGTVEPIEPPEAGIFDIDDGELDVESMNTEDFAAAASGGAEPSPAEVARQEHPDLDDTIDHPAPELTSLSDELEAAAPPLVDPDSDEHEAPKPIEPRPAAGEEEGEPEAAEATGEGDSSDEGDDDSDDEGDSGEESSDDADLLEETPEFLKDAPEGEDLWFEQGPPKDFDFD